MDVPVTGSTVQLTKDEEVLLEQVDFNIFAQPHQQQATSGTFAAAAQLGRSLVKRDAIPQPRKQYFTDPQCYVGGHGSSRQEVLQRNDTTGSIFTNPAFLKWLWYFVFRPQLPSAVMETFQNKVIDCGSPFTSSDANEVADYARGLARSHGLDAHSAPEEFFKLALECGLDASDSRVVRDRVMRMG